MKVLKCKIVVVLFAFVLMGHLVSAKEFYQEVKKETPIAYNGKVDLSNTRGTIDVRTWDENKVSIEVLITVNARNQADANEVFERIKINFDSYANIVSAKTNIKNLPKWSWNFVRSEYTVDYIV